MTLYSKALDTQNNFVVTLDGPSGAGKGTIGKMLAKRFNLVYFQSSLVYRLLAFECLVQNILPHEREKIIKLSEKIQLNQNNNLENEEVANIASIVAAIPEVRDNLNKFLINLIQNTPRIIMEGRDIGTVIAPNADLKIFITADLMTRANRRYNQLQLARKNCIISEVFEQLKLRDERDSTRACSPLTIAKNALVVDSSHLNPQEVIENILNYISFR